MANHSVHSTAELQLTVGEQIPLIGGPLIEIVEVAQPDAHLYSGVDIYGSELRALQPVWADRRGRWPWDAGFWKGRGGQRVLGARATAA